jgi:S1-C subfamily serine protease
LAPARLLKLGSQFSQLALRKAFSSSISQGIVSGLRRDENAKLIQTTAAISHGLSGGGLFNANGDLIGITTLYLDDSQQLNFAVPAEWVSNLLTNPIMV